MVVPGVTSGRARNHLCAFLTGRCGRSDMVTLFDVLPCCDFRGSNSCEMQGQRQPSSIRCCDSERMILACPSEARSLQCKNSARRRQLGCKIPLPEQDSAQDLSHSQVYSFDVAESSHKILVFSPVCSTCSACACCSKVTDAVTLLQRSICLQSNFRDHCKVFTGSVS